MLGVNVVDEGLPKKPPSETATPMAVKRLTMDYKSLIADPLPSIIAHPKPSNILEWHYVIYGSPDTCYDGGYYHGKLVFPSDFPFRPPAVYMLTPSGRFQINEKICLTISDFHPGEWNPSWTVSTILTGFLSIMNDTDYSHIGAMKCTDKEKRKFALESREFNLKNSEFCEIFEDLLPLMRMNDEDFEDDDASSNIDDTEKDNEIDEDALFEDTS